ncbi:MAG: CDP-alcohol phosphatidyltransferase family protein [Gemmatimonadetes bacterium]|nr:CDP-alcohol phosphatidyltransferase family protein [Gemmatimonadota bacterium]
MKQVTSATRTRPLPPLTPSTWHTPAADMAIGLLLLVAISAASCWMLALPTRHLAETTALYAVLAALVLRKLPRTHPGPGVGSANRVTLTRSTFVLPVVALSLQSGPLSERGYWWILVLSAVAIALDGIDGRVARRTRTESPFGARFDMELDALLLLALSALAWQSGKMGPWVLLIGGLRYAFWLAGVLWQPLREPLFPSFRRKTVCVVQGVSLIVCLAPITFPTLAAGIAAGALFLLVYSFAVDTWRLLTPFHRSGPRGAVPE